eukprot:4885848-Prymnesium_polylepis.1
MSTAAANVSRTAGWRAVGPTATRNMDFHKSKYCGNGSKPKTTAHVIRLAARPAARSLVRVASRVASTW